MASSDSRHDGAGDLPAGGIARVMWPLMLVLFISTLDQTIVAAALHGIGEALGDAADASWVATAYLLTSAISTLILGKLGDMKGRKVVFQASVAIFVAGSLLCAIAPSMAWLIGARALQGVGGGGLNSLVMAIVGDLSPPRERARHQAVLGLVPALAIVLGPVLGGLIVDHGSWPWIFAINIPIGVVAFLLIETRLQLPARRRVHRLDWRGALLSTVFTTSFLLLAVRANDAAAVSSWQTVALALVSVASLVGYVRGQRTAREPLTPLSLFASSIFSISSALFFVSTAALFVAMLFVPLLLQSVLGYSASAAGASIVPLLLGLIVASMVAGAAISRSGRYALYPRIGAVLCALGFYALAQTDRHTAHGWTLSMLAVLGAGMGFFIQVVVLAGQNAVDPRHLGVATGTLNFFKTLGGASGAAIFGSILASGLEGAVTVEARLAAFQHVLSAAMLLMAFAFVLALLLKEKPLSAEMIEVAEGNVDVPEY
jgi:EmrB/QacA subfamily drug resistance transporter